jgi:hypothetical protein
MTVELEQTVVVPNSARADKIRPDGSSRTLISDGGTNCTPSGFEQSGDADPGWSANGATIYSSRGFPVPPVGVPANATERKLYAFSSDAWYPGKPEMDLSLPSEPSGIEGVPKERQMASTWRCFEFASTPGCRRVESTEGRYEIVSRLCVAGFRAGLEPAPSGCAAASTPRVNLLFAQER